MKIIRYLLFPFSLLYATAMSIRNRQYQRGSRPISAFERMVISVGNLSTGGTGKSPMIEYLIRLLKDRYALATISRGYGRKTKGTRIASEADDSKSLGDEPFQFYRKFGNEISVVVGEERILAIPELLLQKPDTEVFLLDDAFQHRKVARDLDILLTDYAQPFYADHVLPTGNLRERRAESKRAELIVVTKCPDLRAEEKQRVVNKIRNYNEHAEIYFSQIVYGDLEPVFSSAELKNDVAVISAIAKPKPFYEHLKKQFTLLEKFEYVDHYHFKTSDLNQILRKLNGSELSLITTEKDMVRLLGMADHPLFEAYDLFYQPIEVKIDRKEEFDRKIFDAIDKRLAEMND